MEKNSFVNEGLFSSGGKKLFGKNGHFDKDVNPQEVKNAFKKAIPLFKKIYSGDQAIENLIDACDSDNYNEYVTAALELVDTIYAYYSSEK